MEECTCFLLIIIFAHTHSILYKPNINSKSVNLELETVLEFNHKDKEADIKLLDNIQQVITEIRTVIDKNSNTSKVENFRRNSRDDTLTDFIQEAVIILNTYEDNAFEDFIRILNTEIRNFNYRGCKFYELMQNKEIEKFISENFDSIKDKSTRFKKAAIIALSDVLSYNKKNDINVKELVNYINSLYRKVGDKFQKVLSDLKSYGKLKSRKPKTDLVKIIKNGLRSIIFDHYTNLNINERRLLKRKIENLWKRYRHNLTSKGNISNMKPYNPKNSRNIMNEAKYFDPDSTKFKRNINKETKLNKIKTKQSKQEKVVSEHNDIKNVKKRYKYTEKDTIDEPRDIQEKKTKQTVKNMKQLSDIKNQKYLDSLYSSLESIEPNQDLQHKTLGQKTYKLKKVTKKSEEIEHLNKATNTPINNTTQKLIWIEESTGRLPQAVLDKLANKSRGYQSNLNLGRKLYENGHKYKRNKDHNKRSGTVHRPEIIKTRRKGYGVGYDKVHGKKYYLKNQRLRNRYSDPKYAHETILESQYEKTFENTNEQYHKNAYEDNYESQNQKITEKVYATENKKTREKIYESDYQKMHDKAYESENERRHGKVYDRQFIKPRREFQEKRQKFNRKDLNKHQYNKRNSALGMNKRKNLLTRSTTKQLLQMLDVQMPEETGKGIKSIARGTIVTSKLPGTVRQPHAQVNEKDVLKPTEQTLPPPAFVKNLERPLKAVKNEASSNTEEVSKVKHRFVVKSNIVKPKEIVTIRPLDENQFVNDYNNKLEIEESVGSKTELLNEHEEFEDLEELKTPEAKLTPEYANEFHSNYTLKQDKANMAGTVYKNKEPLLNYVTNGDSKINTYDKEREIMTEIKFKPENPIDYKVRQDKFKIAGVSVDKKDFNIKEHKDSKITLSETGFRSGIKLTSIDNNRTSSQVKFIDNNVTPDIINKTKTLVHNTDLLIQDIADKDSKHKENDTKTDVKSKNTFIPVTNMIPIHNQAGQNELKIKETVDNEINFIAGPATDVDSIKNNTKNSKKSETIFRSDVNRDFQVTQNELKVPGAADNEIEPINENNNVKDIDFTINDLGNVFEKTNKFEARFHKSDLEAMLENIKDTMKKSNRIETPDILSEFQHAQDKNSNNNLENGLILRSGTNNFADKIDQIVTGAVHNKTNVNEKESKSKKEIVDNYHRIYHVNGESKSKKEIVDNYYRIYHVNGETTMNKNTQKEKDHLMGTKQQNIVKEDINIAKINTVTLEAKYKQKTDTNKIEKTDQNLLNNNVDVATNNTTIIINKNLYSTITPIKSTETTTTTVIATKAVTVPTTLRITVPVSIPVVISSKIPGTWIPSILTR